MKANDFLLHIILAIILSALAIIGDLLLSVFFTGTLMIQINITLVLALYLSFIISKSQIKAGKLSLISLNLSMLLISLYFINEVTALLISYLCLIFINRAILSYGYRLSVLADLGLCLVSASAVLYLIDHGYSYLMALWCFLLLQALHSLLPSKKSIKNKKQRINSQDKFDQALHSAEEALHKILS